MARRRRRWPWVAGVVLILAGAGAMSARPLAFRLVTRKTATRFPEVRWLPADSLVAWLADRGRAAPLLLDARTAEEYDVSHLPSAERVDPYRPDLKVLGTPARDTAIVVYSSAGYRGARVAAWLTGQGYTNVRNLTRGIFGWADDGRPLSSDAGPAELVHPYDGRWGLLLDAAHRGRQTPVPHESAAP
jgi:rhodanese-related sulfurtransferase